MKERLQPVVKGTNEKGELIWGFIPMPLWQQAMFPVKYVGDFINFWWKSSIRDKWGDEMEDMPSLTFREYRNLRKKPRHSGD